MKTQKISFIFQEKMTLLQDLLQLVLTEMTLILKLMVFLQETMALRVNSAQLHSHLNSVKLL